MGWSLETGELLCLFDSFAAEQNAGSVRLVYADNWGGTLATGAIVLAGNDKLLVHDLGFGRTVSGNFTLRYVAREQRVEGRWKGKDK